MNENLIWIYEYETIFTVEILYCLDPVALAWPLCCSAQLFWNHLDVAEPAHPVPMLNSTRTNLRRLVVVCTVFGAFFSVAQRRCFHSDRIQKFSQT